MRGVLLAVAVIIMAGCLQRSCGSEVQFVCGNDSVTYQNPCLAQDAGAKISYMGICQSNSSASTELCTDTDGGKNLLEKGAVNEAGQNATWDACAGVNGLQEWHCDSGKAIAETMQCPNGTVCEDGMCTGDICADSDGGKTPGVKGTASKGAFQAEDSCSDSKHVIENYCEGNTAKNGIVECGAMEGCSDGACVQQSVCFDSDAGDGILERGTATTGGGAFTDYCENGSAVHEYWCDGNSVKESVKACSADYACNDGKCVYQNCLDSDAGKDIGVAGQVSKGGSVSKDACVDTNTVMEYYCEANDAVGIGMECQSDEICSEGRCVEAGCVDSDGGNAPMVLGAVSVGAVSRQDECTDDTTLKEYRCNGGDFTYSAVDCFTYFTGGTGICWNRVCAPTSCTDTDGGKNVNLSGSATMTTPNGYSEYHNDECANATAVKEYSCESNWLVYEDVPCTTEQFCFMNACVDSPCIDSDGGEEYAEAGTVVKGQRVEQDGCLDSQTLREWSCSANEVVRTDHACVSGCDAGGKRCITP